MIKNLSLEDFLERNRISTEIWEASNLSWPSLVKIGLDHEENSERLRESADFFARVIQKFSAVHSVRWRVKKVEHLLEKITRKCAIGVEKYGEISVENYYEIVTDLVGIRALHLFKDECFEIDKELRATWLPIETPIAYIRNGDHDDLRKRYEEHNFETKNHPAGYRSVHYVFESQPVKRKVITEVQVRTIFEEGWSEIDHRVRYPNFSDNELVDYFLTIFNRMAGSADEMGGFVQGLAAAIQELEQKILKANQEKDQAILAMENNLNESESARKQDKESKESIERLKKEVEKLKNSTRTESFLSAQGSNLFREFLK